MKRVGLYVKRGAPQAGEIAAEVIEWLKERDCEPLIDQGVTSEYGIPGGIPLQKILNQCDMLAILGGDGTFLAAAREAANYDKPVVGVNLGKLGFLTETPVSNMYDMLQMALDGKAVVRNLSLLDAEIQSEGMTYSFQVLNDVVVSKSALARIIDIRVSIGNSVVTSWLADGLIVATPTGSTAYSMAAGGPICHPSVDALIVTPICPHLLANRPLLIPGDTELNIELVSPGDSFVTFDGQVGREFTIGDVLIVRRSKKSLRVLRNPSRTYYQTLRDKLRWGER